MRARLVRRAEDWRWSSARAHLRGRDDALAPLAPLRALVPDLRALLAAGEDDAAAMRLRKAETTGRPLGSPAWIAALEARTGRVLAPRKRGPKRRPPGLE